MGVDIAKSYLDAALGNEQRRFANERIGHRELIKWVKQLKAPVQVICESSGGYERALVQALGWCKSESQPGASQPGAAICASGWYFSKDRSDRRKGTVRFWRADATGNNRCFSVRAGTFTRVRESTQASNASFGDGTESSGAS
jgi:hypothetical protein